MLDHRPQAPGLDDPEDHDDGQGDRHDDRLDQVHRGHSGEAAHRGVADDDQGPDHHRRHVVPAEEAVEQLADSGQAGGHIGHEEDQDDQGGDAHDHRLLLAVPLGDEAGDGDGVQLYAVAAQPLGHQQEIQIGACGQTDGGPAGVGHAGQIGQAGDPHEQVAAHVAGLGAHGGDQGPHAPAPQIEALGALLGPAADHHAGEDHEAEIEDDGPHDTHLRTSHSDPSHNNCTAGHTGPQKADR